MSEPVTITVYGQPAPQGSKRAFAVRGKGGVPTGRVAVIESSHDRVKSWRQAVIDAAQEIRMTRFPFDGPVSLTMVFSLPRPKGHYSTAIGKSHLVKPSAPRYPSGMPDLSKLCRATEDALEAVGLIRNDCLITDYGRLSKLWCGTDCGALDVPGAVITIRPLTEGPTP